MSEFGEEFDKDWPLHEFDKNLSEFGKQLLQKCLNIKKPIAKEINIQEFIKKSDEFPIRFPTDNCRIKTQPIERHTFIEQEIASAYPLLHERVLFLILSFLEHKLKYGSSREKKLYENMSVDDFVQRLLTKRCVTFVGFHDCYLLLTKETGHSEPYLKIGTDKEEPHLTLTEVLSYDEVKISALLSISGHTEFINDGDRNNAAKIENDLNKIERQGVVVGLVGARFARQHKMEYEDIKITEEQNITKNGYGCKDCKTPSNSGEMWRYLFSPKKYGCGCKESQESSSAPSNSGEMWQYLFSPKKYALNLEKRQDYRRLWNKFYEDEDYLYSNVSRYDKRFSTCLQPEHILDNVIMKKRFAILFDTLLMEANDRALKRQKLAYIHVVGIGLGVWLAAPEQENIFMATFQQRLKYLLPKLNNIGVIHFSWFHLKEWEDLKDEAVFKSETHTEGGIKMFISKRKPHQKLLPPYENMLPIVAFAWDGNALPGNEFWMGSLCTSSDSAAASSTLITELFNPHINTEYVNSNNLHIASTNYGIIHVQDYAKKVLNKTEHTVKV